MNRGKKPPGCRRRDDGIPDKIRFIVRLGITARWSTGRTDHETIRREVTEQLVKGVKENFSDIHEQEVLVAYGQREIARVLAGGEPPVQSFLVG